MGERLNVSFILECCEEWSAAQTTEEYALLPIFSNASVKLTEEDITQLTRIAMYLNSTSNLRALVARRGWYEVACIYWGQDPDELEKLWDDGRDTIASDQHRLRTAPDNEKINVVIAGQYKC